MKILTQKELEFVGKMDKAQQGKLHRAIHESGHAIIALIHGYKFHDITHERLDGFIVRPGFTIREIASGKLGGWAAVEVFCNNKRNIFDGEFKQDVADIKTLLSETEHNTNFESLLKVVQPYTKALMETRTKELKKMAFALLEKGRLTYEECKRLFYESNMN